MKSLSLIVICSLLWTWIFNNAVTSIADVRHIVMILLWDLVTSLCSVTSTLTMAYEASIITSAHQTCENSQFLSNPGQDNLGRIRISFQDTIQKNTFLCVLRRLCHIMTVVTLSTLSKIFSRRQIEIIFYFSQKTDFDISCKFAINNPKPFTPGIHVSVKFK